MTAPPTLPPGRSVAPATAAGALGLLAAAAPHVLHHAGLLAGAAFLAGAVGNMLFLALGLAMTIPLLRRLYRRFGTWQAPLLGLAAFALMAAASSLAFRAGG